LSSTVDDLDGIPGDDVSTVTFALDGVSYEIDLREENAARLRESLSDYVDSRAGSEGGSGGYHAIDGPGAVGGRPEQGADESDPRMGEEERLRPCRSGRIPANVIAAFEEAHAKKSRRARKG
jgi:hypothetical protein